MEVRERILLESGQLFARYGIKSMTMDLLAEEMGISKRTIYERFKDKDTLLLEVIRHYQAQTKADAHEIIEESENAIVALFRIIRQTIDQMTRLSPTFFHDFKKYHNKIFNECMSDPGFRDYSVTSKLLETGVEQGIFRDDFDLQIVNRSIHALFDLFGHQSPMLEEGIDRKQMFDHMLIPFFRGLCTEKGQKILEDSKNYFD